MINTQSVLARKLSTFIALSPPELRRLAELQATSQLVKRGKQIIREGEAGHEAFVLQSGWACSYKDLPSGGRQIISFPIAGDCVGLRSILLKTADHSFDALTDAVVSSVDRPSMLQTFSDFPRLGAAILWAASRDEAMVVEHLVSIGRRNAIERTAYFFMELAERLKLVGLSAEAEFECPLTQYVLADALGLSPIHVNRVLRQLRELDLLTAQHGTVKIHDLPGLRKLSGFQNGDLH
jgi:CRP-like cAMP-binding protein